ncbi:Ndc1p [Lachancea thermotolerans CBS 6340]|uniref:KLTH0G04840p n=1 Tax=Lachancea thermotolerans (strain ATCC 56472 / CBS 6340 / NRRL Y-8284) TaxID=559295 RepID=C5DM00_LACTC|nr:KLTH0G04840p [Lachancea thermotolerans CBS 6340]CAR24811.1 KLTH0G04840p [Lachancea thermotolerans CBS 6340]
MESSVIPSPLSSRYSYHAIFSDVCKTRFSHLVARLLFSMAVCIGALASALAQRGASKWERTLSAPGKGILVYVGMLTVVLARKNYLHVRLPGYSSALSQAYWQLCSGQALVQLAVHILSSICIASALRDTVTGALQPQRVFGYRLAVWLLVPGLYTAQHVAFDLGRLAFRYGAQHQHPQQFIITRIHNVFAKCGVLAIAVALVLPVGSLYLGPRTSSLGVAGTFQCVILAFMIFVIWDLVNLAFNAYLSIGCLHKGKPISSLSSTPMETLISGLSSKKPFTKLTAFQELSYRATSPNIQLRLPIYHTRHRNVYIWPSILKECLNTIESTNSNVSAFMKSVEQQQESLRKPTANRPESLDERLNENGLFGNDYVITSSSQSRLPGSPPTSETLTHRITLQNNNIFARGNGDTVGSSPFQFSDVANNPILTRQTTITDIVGDCLRQLKDTFFGFFFPVQDEDSSPQLSLFELWRVSKKMQAEKLVPLPVCYAECVIALMGLLIKSLEEDPKGGVVSSVGEVLKILERSVGSLGGFAEWKDSLVSRETATPDVVTILYDLSINAFLEIVLGYNELLNNVYLDEDVVKLSKWVLEICNE